MKKEEQSKRNAKHNNKGYDRYQEVEEDKFWKDRLKGTGRICSSY